MILYLSSIPDIKLRLFLISLIASFELSTKKTILQPLLIASSPREPLPAKRSRTLEPAILLPITLKILSLTLSRVGLMFKSSGPLSLRPLNSPAIILINHHRLNLKFLL